MGSLEGNVDHLDATFTTWISAALLVAVSALFVGAEVSINAVNGLWGDELASLWFSDVSLPFTRAFSERFVLDNTPPLYYTVLYWVRWLISDDRTAILAVNIAAIMIAAGAVFVASRRAGLSKLAVVGLAAFVLSGPVLLFASEGRSYCLGMAVVFVASWYAALAVKDPHDRPVLASFIALGAVAALTHVYAALICGGLGAGLLILSLFSRRRDLIGPGLALGLSASVVFVIWLSMTWSSMGYVPSWIEFSPKAVLVAAGYVKNLAVGGNLALPLLIFLLVFGMLDRATRPFFIAFGGAFALFVLLPLIASLKQPIIVGRYWLVGAPALITLVIFAAWTWFFASDRIPKQRNMRLVAISGALLFLGADNIHGFIAARTYVAKEKMIWRGAKIVRPLLDRCPAGVIHIATDLRHQSPSWIWPFSKMTGASISLFVDARLQSTQNISPAMTPCPVLGWAEHIMSEGDFISQDTDADLVQLLKIEASPQEVDVRRHRTGFVVLKRVPRQY